MSADRTYTGMEAAAAFRKQLRLHQEREDLIKKWENFITVSTNAADIELALRTLVVLRAI